jgi:methylenetetrahydrofolate dehydrogenase (NADP+)/methenyltetrahydrofolate cyclohydrolase
VRSLKQSQHVQPKLAIVQTVDNPVIDKYVSLKKVYGQDIGIEVEHFKLQQNDALSTIASLNQDPTVHGIIIQLPLADPSQTDSLVNAVNPQKDVDGLGENHVLDPATPMAINWLLTGYNIELKNKNILIVGRGRLVGKPLFNMWQQSGLQVTCIDETAGDITKYTQAANIVITATGVPSLITSEMLRPDTVLVDAGTASESGKVVGDIADDVRDRHDLTITPAIGGVGPLTVVALFDNVIRATQASVRAD